MRRFLMGLAMVAGLATPSFSAPLDLGGLARVGTISNGAGGLFYDGFFLSDDFLDPLNFNGDATGGDFAGLSDNLLLYDFADPGFSSFTIDAFGAGELFAISDVGFSGDTIEFLMSYDSGTANPFPGAAGAVLSFTSADFSTAAVTLDAATSLEDFFLSNADPFGEYATTVTFAVQALDTVSGPGPTPIPLPAGGALLVTALLAVAGVRRARSHSL